MNIMYRVYSDGAIILRLSDNLWIPADILNKDYIEYLAWLDAGGVPEYDNPEA